MANRGSYESAARGSACELLVLADLLVKGYEVTRPLVDFGDDLHARFPEGWYTVQVKATHAGRNTWHASNRKPVTSDILALVNLDKQQIRYKAAGKPLPKDLK